MSQSYTETHELTTAELRRVQEAFLSNETRFGPKGEP